MEKRGWGRKTCIMLMLKVFIHTGALTVKTAFSFSLTSNNFPNWELPAFTHSNDYIIKLQRNLTNPSLTW